MNAAPAQLQLTAAVHVYAHLHHERLQADAGRNKPPRAYLQHDQSAINRRAVEARRRVMKES